MIDFNYHIFMLNVQTYKPTEDDRKLVAKLASFGISEEKIASCIFYQGRAINAQTLRNHFIRELEVGPILLFSKAYTKLEELSESDDEGVALKASIYIVENIGPKLDRLRAKESLPANSAVLQIIDEMRKDLLKIDKTVEGEII